MVEIQQSDVFILILVRLPHIRVVVNHWLLRLLGACKKTCLFLLQHLSEQTLS